VTHESSAWLAAAPEVAIDFETVYSADYSVQDLGYSAYVRDSRFDALLVAVSDGDKSIVCNPRRFPWPALHGKALIAHNAAFDQAVFRRLQETGVIPPEVQPAGWHDTAALCAYIGAPRALDEAAAVLVGMTLDKSVRDRMRNGGDLFDRTDEYAAQDARAAALIWRKYGAFWPYHERRLSALTTAMGFRGISIDRKKAERIFQDLEDQAESARLSLPWVPAQAPASPKALAAECRKHGIPPPETTSTKEDAFDEWLEQYGATEPARLVRIVQEIRSLNRSAKVLETMLSRVRADERIDAHTLYFGASTGRWSGGGHGLNLQNLNRGDAGNADLRGCLVAPPGRKLVIADLSQIEPRCLAWMAGDRAWLDLVRSGVNPYEAQAMTAHGWKGQKLKHTNPRLYALSKAERLGLGYGCGAEKFVTVARVLGGIDISLEESRKIVRDFRRGNPTITSLWNRLEKAFSDRDGKHYRLPLPSGRKLRYFDVSREESTARVTLDGPRLNFYGGRLCENLIQAIARDVFADGLLRVEDAGLNPILTVHDEVICEVPEGQAEDALREALRLMTIPPAWAPDLPVAAEGEIAAFYKK
jgi:DNA polymerase I-like protein with 3'-5' exonuclease and polymerase domains